MLGFPKVNFLHAWSGGYMYKVENGTEKKYKLF